VAGDGTVSLSWSAPLSSGNLPLQGYLVLRGTEASENLPLHATLGDVLTFDDTGLVNGQPYYYRIIAFNYLGRSIPSALVAATPAGPSLPSAPLNLTLSPGNHTVSLSWSAPADDGGSPLLGFRVYRGNHSGGERLVAEVGLAYAYSDTGLVNNRTFYYKVSALTAIGEGPAANGSARTPVTGTNDTTEPDDPDELPDWTDNFTLTSGIATVIAMVVGFGIAYLFLRGDGKPIGPSSKGPDERVDDEPEGDGPNEEEEDE
jgi:titin